MVCPKCGMALADRTDICPNCGAACAEPSAPREARGVCPNCGASYDLQLTVCPNCGMPTGTGAAPGYDRVDAAQRPQRSRLVAAALALFFGPFGLEHFYLGDATLGVLHIIVTCVTWGIGGLIWGFVDALQLLTYKKNTDAYGVPLRDFNF